LLCTTLHPPQVVESGLRKNRMNPPSTRARYCCQELSTPDGSDVEETPSMLAMAALSTGTSSWPPL